MIASLVTLLPFSVFYQLGLTIIGVQRQNTHTTHVFPADDKKGSHKLYSDCKGIV